MYREPWRIVRRSLPYEVRGEPAAIAVARYQRLRGRAQLAVAWAEDKEAAAAHVAQPFVEVAAEVVGALIEKGFAAGFPLSRYYNNMENAILIAVTEKRTKQQIGMLAEALETIL